MILPRYYPNPSVTVICRFYYRALNPPVPRARSRLVVIVVTPRSARPAVESGKKFRDEKTFPHSRGQGSLVSFPEASLATTRRRGAGIQYRRVRADTRGNAISQVSRVLHEPDRTVSRLDDEATVPRRSGKVREIGSQVKYLEFQRRKALAQPRP